MNVTSLKFSFKSLNSTTIQKLTLENNDWNAIPDDMFSYLLVDIICMSLNNNLFQELNSSVFLPIRSLRKLFIQKNEIVFVDLNGLITTEILDLSNNNIYAIPNFCKENNRTFVSQLKNLSLAYNSIRQFSKESFRCLDNLKYLNLDGNRVRRLGDNVFGLLNSIRRLSIGVNQQLEHIASFAFNSSSLQVLRLHRNHFRFSKRKLKREDFNPLLTFGTIPNLKELDLSNNHLKDYVILGKLF